MPTNKVIYPLIDPDEKNPDSWVVVDDATTIADILIKRGVSSPPSTVTVLAFYSCATGEPYNFQFIYLPGGYSNVQVGENNVIKVANCQYLIQNPEYVIGANYTLPAGCNESQDLGDDTQVSSKYRGARYSFNQQSEYIPVLDRYCSKFKKGKEEYYGYLESEYISPTLVQNVISNAEFKNTSGWVGTYYGTASYVENKPTVEAVNGRFDSNVGKFYSAIEDLKNGNYRSGQYTPYLKITIPPQTGSFNPILINTGFYDNRTLIKNVEPGEPWILKSTIFRANGQAATGFEYQLAEVEYDAQNGRYTVNQTYPWTQKASAGVLPITHQKCSDKVFSKKQIKLIIYPPTSNSTQVYYLKNMELYKGVLKNPNTSPNNVDNYIAPGIVDTDGIINTYYILVKASEINNSTLTSDELHKLAIRSDYIYKESYGYSPIFIEGAEKIRAVDAKESNYFNILQSIAEKFGAWLSIEVEHEDNTGAIIDKRVRFKKYVGDKNYASFRYGVNLKDIQRTSASKEIVTKLIVKQNSNQHGEDGFCSIVRASNNPTGENYIYDFRHYINEGMLDGQDYIKTIYSSEGWSGEDVNTPDWNIQGYAPRLKKINNAILPLNTRIAGLTTDLVKLKAEETVQDNLQMAAKENLIAVEDEFIAFTGVAIGKAGIDQYKQITCIIPHPDKQDEGIYDLNSVNGNTKHWAYGATVNGTASNSGKTWEFTITLTDKTTENTGLTTDQVFYFKPTFTFIDYNGVSKLSISRVLSCTIKKGTLSATMTYEPAIIDTSVSKIVELTNQHVLYSNQISSAESKLAEYAIVIESKEAQLQSVTEEREKYLSWKKKLNQAFFSKYSQFIQEGTWISEEHIDDNKYYNDAMSVLYNSCLPKLTYSINVLELSALPGYELFSFDLGDTTYAEDPEFFGDERRVEVVISEINENLDDSSKNNIKTQTFKNQFKDLFSKITATVQQAQYNTGSYEKAVALAEADASLKGAFLSDALRGMGDKLSIAGQTTVEQGLDGITLTDSDTKDQLRLIGGAILMSTQDEETGLRKWKTGLTPEGISASLITAGTLNAGNVQIMNGSDPTFRWDAFGLSAFEAEVTDTGEFNYLNAPNPFKFVRFDKYGIYGVNNEKDQVNGMTWIPKNLDDVHRNATFALTWQGLQVTGRDGTTVKLGRSKDELFSVYDKTGKPLLCFGVEGYGEFFGKLNESATFKGKPLGEAVDEVVNSATKDITDTIGYFYEEVEDIRGVSDSAYLIAANTEGSLAVISTQVDKNTATISTLGSVLMGGSDPNNPRYNIAGTQVKTDGDSSELQLVAIYGALVGDKYTSTETIIKGATIALGADKDESYIVLNADSINFRTSQMTILEKDDDEETLLFKAGGGKVYLAGWGVSPNALYKGAFGEENSLYLSARGYEPQRPGVYFGNHDVNAKWAIAAGKNFGVTTEGELYALAGRIGNMEIAALGLEEQGVNMVERADEQYTLNSKNAQGHTYELNEAIKPVTNYALTIWASGRGTIEIYDSEQKGTYLGSISIKSSEFVPKTLVFSLFSNNLPKYAGLYFYLPKPVCASPSAYEINIEKVKMEIGVQATEWTPSGVGFSKMSNNVDGDNYSWKFSPSEGMMMWNGHQDNGEGADTKMVFKINESGLFVKGNLVADVGSKIGIFEVQEKGLSVTTQSAYDDTPGYISLKHTSTSSHGSNGYSRVQINSTGIEFHNKTSDNAFNSPLLSLDLNGLATNALGNVIRLHDDGITIGGSTYYVNIEGGGYYNVPYNPGDKLWSIMDNNSNNVILVNREGLVDYTYTLYIFKSGRLHGVYKTKNESVINNWEKEGYNIVYLY